MHAGITGCVRIGEQIANKKYERGLSEDELAEIFGVSQATVNRWVTGLNTPTRTYWPAIARFLGISQRDVADMCVAEKRGRSVPGIEARLDRVERQLAHIERLVEEMAGKQRR